MRTIFVLSKKSKRKRHLKIILKAEVLEVDDICG
jgi:hypothetical protein